MAALPPLSQIVGNHAAVFEAYYNQADPAGTGSIGSLDAAKFLKKSTLKDNLLSQIWDQSDPTGKGYLEKHGFYIALKLISLAQSGQEISLSKLQLETPPPNLGPVELPQVEGTPMSPSGSSIPWAVKPQDKAKYDQLFETLQPISGLVSGEKVKPMLLNSKLPLDVLSRIWDLSDVDKDGYLDKDEFAVAMHLVYRVLENDPVPTTLPSRLIPPSKRKRISLPGAVQVLPGMAAADATPPGRVESPPVSAINVNTKTVPWIIGPSEKANYDILFKKTDTDMDGFVSGQEIREIFLQSGLPNNALAHIWAHCDMLGSGKLNSEQFALAMYLVQQRINGVELPQQLPLEMIPPSMRSKPTTGPAAFGVMDGTNAGPYNHAADFSAIKELDMISNEIEELKREKMQLEKEKAQRDADIKIRNGEVQSLQKDLDAITATLQQLENQKKEAQKRLDELDDKRSNLENNVTEMKEKCEDEQKQIDSLKTRISNQEKSVKEQEDELNQLRRELSWLKEEEMKLEKKVEAGKQQLESVVKNYRGKQLQISQTKARVQHLQDQQRSVMQSIATYNAQINGDFSPIPPPTSESDQFSTRATAGSSPISVSGLSRGSSTDEFKDDPFKGKDPFSSAGDSHPVDPFQNEDPFKGADPFQSDGFNQDPFASEDPFKDAFPSIDDGSVSSKEDPFSSVDSFGASFPGSKKKIDPFEAFGRNSGGTNKNQQKNTGDLFGSDPFAPQRKSKSPTPAIPPKQKKQPPPRPAPPRPKSTPAGAGNKQKAEELFGADPFSATDPFASSSGSLGTGTDTFANFADFSPSKFEDGKSAWGTSQ